MTVCNMPIEAGARAGMIAPDQTTFDYIHGRPMAPQGAMWDQAVDYWSNLISDNGAQFDTEYSFSAHEVAPQGEGSGVTLFCCCLTALLGPVSASFFISSILTLTPG